MKKGLVLVLGLSVLPVAAHASAVKECRVEAVVKEIKDAGKTPVFLVTVTSAKFERGHSMGEDCTELTRFPDREVKLTQPFVTKVGAQIVLIQVDIRNVSPGGPSMHTSWEIHPDELKKSPTQAK